MNGDTCFNFLSHGELLDPLEQAVRRPRVNHPRGGHEGQMSLSSWPIRESACLLYMSPTAFRQMCNGSNNGNQLNIISCTKTRKYLLKGYPVFLANITTKTIKDKSKEKQLEDVPIVRDFSEVFPEDLPGKRWLFKEILILMTIPVRKKENANQPSDDVTAFYLEYARDCNVRKSAMTASLWFPDTVTPIEYSMGFSLSASVTLSLFGLTSSPCNPDGEGVLVQAGINQCWEPSMTSMLYRDILSMLVVSHDRGVMEHSEPIIPLEGPDVALESPHHPLVPDGVVDVDNCKHRSFTTLLGRVPNCCSVV
nr:putative reverse transcriptase domain-containing protein [Tanacetum cinerariifolium]